MNLYTFNNKDSVAGISGLFLRTSGDADVGINLSHSRLFLQSTPEFGHHFFIIDEGYNLSEKQTFDLLLQPLEANTIVTICPSGPQLSVKPTARVAEVSSESPWELNCSLMNVSNTGGLVLHNISVWSGIEITSDKPVCILSGSGTHLSTMNTNAAESSTSTRQSTLITWNINSPSERWTNQLLLVCQSSQRRVNISVLCK